MNEFVEFMREHYAVLLTALLAVVELIFIFIKRKPKSIDDFKLALSEVVAVVPELVSKVERPGDGTAKKLEVLSTATKLMSYRIKRKLTDSEIGLVQAKVAEKIEAVLCTPTKKEKINEK